MSAELLGQGVLKDARRIVVKVGSSLVTNEGRGVDAEAIGNWCRQLAALAAQGRELVMVSSGAIAEGMKRLGWVTRPKEVHELQAAAAVGQMGLAQMYESKLREHGMGSAQVLLTHADLADRERYLNARSTLLTLLQHRVLPVINENDTVVNDEIKFGDNDTLGALVANLVEADALVILTDQKGLYSADPRKDPSARFIDVAVAGTPELEQMAGGAGSSLGRGGMITKILAAKRAAGSGASTVIAWGREPDVLLRLASGEAIGTALVASTQKQAARKQWMVDHLQLRGAVIVDAGAASKLREDGKSLLPIGVTEVQGEFHRGDVISVRDGSGRELARGLTNYGSAEARLIARKASNQFELVLGYAAEPELIHRDNLVLV
ncbi:MAG: glutamate 5-kinase [Roseateles asaccharophilus]|uniref:Glutamate 5-kinase n=1 Tax=Roseateles asaccharophilus TaxID=582607 RepID=A0A4R6N3P2_9BURK|nr:glutamate 5-kinase [Roseateles asaccharophilus]MDN3544030.1 glutamate 5-kinase [Roseateles asaccharophilus]TDP09375.1 glutamate 5-kinase [Roseateles asaccharophilus]